MKTQCKVCGDLIRTTRWRCRRCEALNTRHPAFIILRLLMVIGFIIAVWVTVDALIHDHPVDPSLILENPSILKRIFATPEPPPPPGPVFR